jgi:hypothetical protein
MVLDLLIVAWLFVAVDYLLMPAGLVLVLDVVVVRVAGACAVAVVAGAAAGVWARAAALPNRLMETRKPRMRFIKYEK